MKLLSCMLAGAAVLFSASAWSHENGTHTIESKNDPATTMAKIEKLVTEKGMTVFAHIDHAAGAAKVDLALRPTDLIIFGNPKGGTPLMQCSQLLGLDLPLKMLVWQDEKGQTQISYNEPQYFADRYKLGDCGKGPIEKITNFLELVSRVAAAKE